MNLQQQNSEKAQELKQASGAAWPSNMKPSAAAAYLDLSGSLLAKMRMKSDPRTGPPFARIGKAIIYRRSDLDEWLASQLESAA